MVDWLAGQSGWQLGALAGRKVAGQAARPAAGVWGRGVRNWCFKHLDSARLVCCCAGLQFGLVAAVAATTVGGGGTAAARRQHAWGLPFVVGCAACLVLLLVVRLRRPARRWQRRRRSERWRPAAAWRRPAHWLRLGLPAFVASLVCALAAATMGARAAAAAAAAAATAACVHHIYIYIVFISL